MNFLQDEFTTIATLDLEPIKVKVMHKESGEGWSLEKANAIEFEYRRYLYLMKKFPNEQAAPSMDVDTFWHYHILDTLKYAQDCQEVFGHFLHHFPYLGLRGQEDLIAHQRVGERMRELYEDTFGERYPFRAIDDSEESSSTAYSVRAAGTAYSVRAADTAYSVRASGTAYSVRASGTAYSVRASGTAYSVRAAETAYSVRTSEAAYSVRAADTDSASLQDLFSVRPRLSEQAVN